MAMRLFNTLSRKTEELRPARDGIVGLYTCGPTVYNYQHVGNYRTYVFEDALKRAMRLLGYEVRHVMNITDVGHLTSQADEGEDKMEVGAQREGKTAREVADFYEKSFLSDIAALNIDFKPVDSPERRPLPEAVDIKCRATDHIAEQTAMVDRLTAGGFTYETSDGIYFDASKFPAYGALAGEAHIAGLKEGARVAANPEKRGPSDFALWKFSPKGAKRRMEWDYRGRPGFPGWHIECSAMAQTYLGETFDVHCGGVDHIPIHHTNEIAQAEAATGKEFVKIWLHGEFLVMNRGKMSKSEGGFIKLSDLVEQGFDPLDYRYFCFGAHYRKQLEFSWDSLRAAKTARARLRERALSLAGTDAAAADAAVLAPHLARFRDALADDLNLPAALAAVHEALGALADAPTLAAFLKEAESVLALGLFEPKAEEALPRELQALFDEYLRCRAAKDYARSDALRRELVEKGISVKDGPKGSSWVKA